MTEPRYQAPIVVLGLKETLRALDKMDSRTRLAVRRELTRASYEIASLARSYVDPEGLSGWGKWKGGYNPGAIASGIQVRDGSMKTNGTREYNIIGVSNTNPAGAIWEVAGRKTDGKKPKKGRRRQRVRVGRHYQFTGVLLGGYGNGQAFVRAIRNRGGAASRTVWAAYDQTDAGDIRKRIEALLIREGRTTQAAIDLNPY